MHRLSGEAQRVLDYLVVHHDLEELVAYETIEQAVGMHGAILNSALRELEEWGAVRTFAGRGQTQVAQVILLPEAWLYVEPSVLGYGIRDDMRVVAEAVSQHEEITAQELEQATGLPTKRLNVATLLLHGYEEKVIIARQPGGTRPYHFASARSTEKTGRWLRSNYL